jgi:hypothetical protein
MMLRKNVFFYTAISLISAVPVLSFAENTPDFFKNTEISGKLRMYDFTRNYSAFPLPQQTAFAVGGNVNVLSPDLFLKGLKADADFYTAQSLGLNNRRPALIDKTLGQSINVLGQAYVQYSYADFLAKIGRQLIDTPWINPSDSRMIPNSYEGVYLRYSPFKDVTLEGLKITKFKNRLANNFSDINLYNPDAMGDPIKKVVDVRNDGAYGLGAEYKNDTLATQLWYYQFSDFAKMGYLDSEVDFSPLGTMTPFIGVQALRETADGKNDIQRFTGTGVNSTAYGLMTGLKNDFFKLTLAYNQILDNNSAYRGGDIISPYTAGYATDPLYTTSMIAGLVEKGQGQAFKTSASVLLLDKKLVLTGSYAKYFVTRSTDTQEVNADAKYNLAGKLKGFSIRDRVGVLYGDVRYKRFIYNRIMLEYKF